MHRYAVALVFGLLGASPILAQDAVVDCENAMTQRDMNICSYEDYMVVDRALNDTYTWALARTEDWGSGTKEALRAAQRTWIAYRDAACNAEGQLHEGGSIRPLIENTCKATLTTRRTQDMRATYEPF
ncbi:lysozyme inhibitor LprI family protein [Pacificibacter marinus]|uniref:Lysozyme inhibitor LprI-like N-terminal domain-containing protein n=1 Tax=Pacificibacter marinus TaxID=658057 RepID=A0A1Y5SN96_9RHOB|nr:lysozyme inhibitor LprI family protein [Pacificibacter marinus]SEK71913.1 Uncharacterized conserved protein YecT, DUF1311 family [Pacificibacter marinus]SLN44044.1 hypothetical protein PAM7971_02112 [Pacificibacter marinus]